MAYHLGQQAVLAFHPGLMAWVYAEEAVRLGQLEAWGDHLHQQVVAYVEVGDHPDPLAPAAAFHLGLKDEAYVEAAVHLGPLAPAVAFHLALRDEVCVAVAVHPGLLALVVAFHLGLAVAAYVEAADRRGQWVASAFCLPQQSAAY